MLKKSIILSTIFLSLNQLNAQEEKLKEAIASATQVAVKRGPEVTIGTLGAPMRRMVLEVLNLKPGEKLSSFFTPMMFRTVYSTGYNILDALEGQYSATEAAAMFDALKNAFIRVNNMGSPNKFGLKVPLKSDISAIQLYEMINDKSGQYVDYGKMYFE